MRENTKGVTILSILELITAAGILISGVISILLISNLLPPNTLPVSFTQHIGAFIIVTILIIGITLYLLRIPSALVPDPIVFVVAIPVLLVIWGVLAIIGVVGITKFQRRALWLTLILNIPVIAIMILMIIGTSGYLLYYAVILPIIVEIGLIILRKDFV